MLKAFKFRKFKPKEDLVIYANTMLFQIIDFIPEGFLPAGSLTKFKDKYVGHMEVYSQSGPFIVEVSANDPRRVIDRLDKKMKEVISGWRIQKLVDAAPQFWRNQNTSAVLE
jgi:hypothetical protein